MFYSTSFTTRPTAHNLLLQPDLGRVLYLVIILNVPALAITILGLCPSVLG